MRLFLGSVISQGRKSFRDTFNRANLTGEVGRASDGSAWNIIRGTWNILSNKAKADSTDYPIIAQNMNVSDIQVELYGTSQGSSAALWVTDSGNWWAVGLVQEPTDCNCTYYYNTYYYYANSTCVAYNPGNYVPPGHNGNYNAANCNSYYCSKYTGGECTSSVCVAYNGSNCNNYAYNYTNGTTRCSGSWNTSNCSTYGCTSYAPYSCIENSCGSYSPGYNNGNFNNAYTNAATAYNYACIIQQSGQDGPYASCQTCYPQYVRIIQSAANTVSTITQWSVSAIASALRVKTSGSQLTISAYSDSSMVSQIGSDLVYTPTGVTITPTFGLTVIPSTYGQGYTTDEIKISRN
jgi:hypothetical protein